MLRLISNLILTRILFPEAFGLMLTASVFLNMLQLFSDTGIKTAIIQQPDSDTKEFLNTALIISVLRGIFLSLFVCVVAGTVTIFFEQPDLKPILYIMSISPLLAGFENPALMLVIKTLDIRRQVIFEIGTQLLSMIVTIYLAYATHSVAALAIGSVSQVMFRAFFSYFFESFRPSFTFNKVIALRLFGFGKYIFVNTLITWATLNLDTLLVGKLLGMSDLAFYNIGFKLGTIVTTLSVQVYMQSFLPAVSSIANDHKRVERIYRKTLEAALMFGIPIFICTGFFSEEIVEALYDGRYHQAKISMFWISIAGVFQMIRLTGSNVLIGLGKPHFETISVFVGLLSMVIFVNIGIIYYGLLGASVGVFVSYGFMTITTSLTLFSYLNFSIHTVLYPWIVSIPITAATIGSIRFVNSYAELGVFPKIADFFLATVISIAVSCCIKVFLKNKFPQQFTQTNH